MYDGVPPAGPVGAGRLVAAGLGDHYGECARGARGLESGVGCARSRVRSEPGVLGIGNRVFGWDRDAVRKQAPADPDASSRSGCFTWNRGGPGPATEVWTIGRALMFHVELRAMLDVRCRRYGPLDSPRSPEPRSPGAPPEAPKPRSPKLRSLELGAWSPPRCLTMAGDLRRADLAGSTRATSPSLRSGGLESWMFHVEPPAFLDRSAPTPRRPGYIGMFHVEPGRKSIGRWPRTRMPDEPDVSRGTGVRRRPGVGEARSGSVTCPVSLILHRVTDSSTTPRCPCIASACSHCRSTAN